MFRVDPWETEQEGWTVTANVLQHFQATINADKRTPYKIHNSISSHTLYIYNIGGETVKLLCGADLLESFATPGLWDREDVSAHSFIRYCSVHCVVCGSD